MDKAPFAYVDPGVTDLGATIGCKEQQVTGLQLVLADALRTHHDHLARGARQRNTRGVVVYVLDQATAIKPRIRGIAAPAIRRAYQAKGAKKHVCGNRRGFFGMSDKHNRLLCHGGWRGAAGAGTEQCC